MDLHDSHLRSIVVRVFVERDQTRFIGLDEVNQPRDAPPLSLELSGLEFVSRDEDERPAIELPPSIVRRGHVAHATIIGA
jgi:hypothetical protein